MVETVYLVAAVATTLLASEGEYGLSTLVVRVLIAEWVPSCDSVLYAGFSSLSHVSLSILPPSAPICER